MTKEINTDSYSHKYAITNFVKTKNRQALHLCYAKNN